MQPLLRGFSISLSNLARGILTWLEKSGDYNWLLSDTMVGVVQQLLGQFLPGIYREAIATNSPDGFSVLVGMGNINGGFLVAWIRHCPYRAGD